MADFQTVMDHLAQVVGGTAPDPTNRPRWFSGRDTGDSSGIQAGTNSQGVAYPALVGCYSAPPDAITDYPVGIVMSGPFEIRGGDGKDNYWQGSELNTDDISLWIVMGRQDSETTLTNLMPYRDLVPAAFAAKMTAFSTANILQAMVRGGKPRSLTTGKGDNAVTYDAIEFVIRVTRLIPRTYTA